MGSRIVRRWRLAVALCLLLPWPLWAQPTTTRVSVGPGGAQGNGISRGPSVSADGRWVAFGSYASNLVPGDTNGEDDVFVHDVLMGTTTRVSVGPGGAQANNISGHSSISADGRWVAFESPAGNLVTGDTNGDWDIFVHDRQTGTTTRVSVGPGGAEGNGWSELPALSADGRWVVFDSWATNLVADDTTGGYDVFVHDQQTGVTTRVSRGLGGAQANGWSRGPGISADGRWVVFASTGSNLVAGDTNGYYNDVFVYDRQTSTTTRVNVGPNGAQANAGSEGPVISADGRWVAFWSYATNLVPGDSNGQSDVFVHDRLTGTTTRVSVDTWGTQGDGSSQSPAISGDGRWVTYFSDARNLVANDTNGVPDVFLHDRQSGTTMRVSLGPGGLQGNGTSLFPAISADGRWVAFSGDASNLVVGDTNGAADVFLYDRGIEVPPAAPEALTASVAGNIATLRWTIPSGGPAPTTFVLEGGLAPGEVLASVPTGSAAPTFTFAAPTGSFYVRIHAVSGTARSAASNEILLHVNVPVAPSTPANLLGLVNGSALALAWTNTYAGGAPTSLVLEVTGAITGAVQLGLTDAFYFPGVPAGTYTLALRAQNAAGSSPRSNAVTLTFPGACSGPPDTPASVVAYALGRTVFVEWSPGAAGPAPTSYVLIVAGSFVGGFPTAARALSGTVGPGSYTLSVAAVNACGTSPASVPQTVVVP